MRKELKNTKFIVLMGLFIAMSVVGGYIKVPNPITDSIAFDSLPAFLATLVLGGVPGAIIGFLGHMASAGMGGFPLSIPIHLFIGVEMSLIMLAFNFAARKFNITIAIVIGIILNGVIAPACFILIPGQGMATFTYLLIPLIFASTLNIILSVLIFKGIKNTSIIKEFK
jgi:riboflavin transporter